MTVMIDAKGIYYKQLNEKVKEVLKSGVDEVILDNVNGQRYIGTGISGNQTIVVNGTPGNDMAAYMDGLNLVINGNAQDGAANTMNDGNIVIHGSAGDTLGYAMRGGEIFVKEHVGYRVGIHMKEYMDKVPAIVVGGNAGNFFGEYMAGGILILLGIVDNGRETVGDFCGTGMHGGVMYIRGEVADYKLGKEVKVVPMEEEDVKKLTYYVEKYAAYFDADAKEILNANFSKIIPFNKRPYGNMYVKC